MHSFIKSAIIFGHTGKVTPKLAIQIRGLPGYAVALIGLPLAISVFIFEQRNERDNGEAAKISRSRTMIQKLAASNPVA